ncbi:protein lin-37 homolog isoform X1 [Carlito syrichta]|uniref:Protein lin-37 homolog isoform X1 n=1 Tax=Carlito syrichta TaxID=1868482 RepID=A0A3Q0DFU3_CARSF|nr:protein lin-37 homolog isoform X1 [Carlito syrichta]
MLFCSVYWRRVTWTGSVWMRKLGKPPRTPTIRIVPLQPLAKGHPPASLTSGGRRGGRWMTGWLREGRSDPVSRQQPQRVGRDLYEETHVLPAPATLDTYVIKLFDRSVDLAQFSENTPLYPICRAWMRNSPSVRDRERSPSSPLPPLPEDEEGSEVTNSKSRDVYKLPPPTAPGPPGDACRSRIPSPLQPETQGTPEDEPSESEPSLSTLIYRNMQRWKRIRQRWKEASHRNQLRYSESMKILREMYDRQ